jgi:putative transcriptional regulator
MSKHAACLLSLLLLGPPVGPGAAGAAEAGRGQLLVATPEMGDPSFARTVVLIVGHDDNGTLGLVVNRPFGEVPVAALLKRLGVPGGDSKGEVPVYYGGPVQPDAALVVHSDDYRADGTTRVTADLDVTGGAQILAAIGAGKGPARSLLVMGYAGWAPGQLENEISAGAWQIVPALPDLVLGGDAAGKWQRAMDLVGTDL